MAVLEKIRNRMGVLISIIIGLALLSFILTDFLNSGKSVFFNKERNRLAEINGDDVSIQEYQKIVEKFTEDYKLRTGQSNPNEDAMDQIRQEAWQMTLDENILGREYDKLGLVVSNKELKEIVLGPNPHPIVKELFTNPETHELNRSVMIQFFKSLDQTQNNEREKFWANIEDQIVNDRIKMKYYDLIKKGLYVTTAQVKQEIALNSKKASISFVEKKFNSIPDSTIKFKESELKNYLKEHAAEFEQEASRDIEYVVFEVKPSGDDYAQAEKWINDIKKDFDETKPSEIKQFIDLKSDTPFNEKYYKKSELSDTLKKLYDGKVGETFGPYFSNNAFFIAMVANIKNLPDSVKASHILIRPEGNTKEAHDKAKALADSIKTAVQKGANIAELAKKYSADPGSKDKGGDLGWFKQDAMVKPFSDACFFGKKGDVVEVESQFGIHVIKIIDQGKDVKKVQIGLLKRNVEPSSATYQRIYKEASAFAGMNNTSEKFDNAVKKENLAVRPANNLRETTKEIPGINGSRELVRWAFKSKKGEVSPIEEFGNKFVVAKLTEVREKGTATLDDDQVKRQIEFMVLRDKKADILMEKFDKEMSSVKSIDELAGKMGITAQNASDITFNSYVLPSVGFEPNVVAASVTVAPNKLSKPIKGNDGVYVIYVTSINEDAQMNPATLASRINEDYQRRVDYGLVYSALVKLADVKDERAKFY